jgi:hypothetical protein
MNSLTCFETQTTQFPGSPSAARARSGDVAAYPPEIPSCRRLRCHGALSPEGIISMQPSVFPTNGNVGQNAVIDRLRDVGTPILVDHGKA